MYKKLKLTFLVCLSLAAVGFLVYFLSSTEIAVLNPKGVIAAEQRDLMIVTTLLMLIVVLPVFAMTAIIAWKYRASNKNAKYHPDWDHNIKLEIVWWGIPLAIIIVLSVITWKSSHELDPHKQLEAGAEPVKVQVVALDWKWLFIYPEQGVASVNFVQFPEDTPVNFTITADAPMNSFWIPELGGQIYAMAGMTTQLNLIADDADTYRGSSANISGEGFSGMNFTAKSSSESEFYAWVDQAKKSNNLLGMNEYEKLSEPSKNNPPTYYSVSDPELFDKIVGQFIFPTFEVNEGSSKPQHEGSHY